MTAPEGRRFGKEIPAPSGFDIVDYLVEFLAPNAPPRFLLITGPVGSGKSSLLRTLLPRFNGPKLFVAYLPIPEGPGTPVSGPGVGMLVVDPQSAPPPSGTPLASSPAGSTAMGIVGAYGVGIPRELAESVARFPGPGRGFVVVDSWDRGSEAYFRSQAPPEAGRTLNAPAQVIGEMRRALLAIPAHLVLVTTPEIGAPFLSTADGVVHLREIERGGFRLRVVSSPKARGGTVPENPDHLYTLESGVFRSLPELPKGFRMPIGPADPDPGPDLTSTWPGSSAFAQAFGRLRTGGFTGITLSADCPDALPHALAGPVAAHALRSGGRLVWIPAPSVRPSRILGILKDLVPLDWIRERVRILSASGDDPGLGDLRSTILPLRRDVGSGGDLRAATAPGVGPLFPEAYRFLSSRPEGTPALYVVSIEGLRATASVATLSLDPATIPVVFSAYARIAGFHGIGFARPDDPLAVSVRSGIDTLVHAEMVCGRPVLFGIRPETAPFVIDWADPEGRYSLLPQW